METRISGINIIGDVRWGTHFCQFYETKNDLIDMLVPYFKAGLENNEYCMWVTSEPLTKNDAQEAMRKAVPEGANLLSASIFFVQPAIQKFNQYQLFC